MLSSNEFFSLLATTSGIFFVSLRQKLGCYIDYCRQYRITSTYMTIKNLWELCNLEVYNNIQLEKRHSGRVKTIAYLINRCKSNPDQ